MLNKEVVFAPIEVTLLDCMGNDLSTVNAARVSFDKESRMVGGVLTEQDVKLVNYLAKHKHLSPFNHAFASFRIKAPVFVARQLVKHEYMPWNEVSRRYVDSPPEFYMPESFRSKADDKKQGSSGPMEKQTYHKEMHTSACSVSLYMYNKSLEEGMCPEQARGYLNLYAHTEWIWSGSLGAFAKMLSLRLPDDTQYETRLVAQLIEEELLSRFPHTLGALLEHV